MPGGTPQSPKLAAFLPAFPALLRQQTKGAIYPAQRAILSAAVEGASVDFDTASRIESRYLTTLIVGQNFKNMTRRSSSTCRRSTPASSAPRASRRSRRPRSPCSAPG